MIVPGGDRIEQTTGAMGIGSKVRPKLTGGLRQLRDRRVADAEVR